ncbi:matrin-3-like [Osmerus mordax]|uniref:matrin-3-like n=1 Tax=Osmerus mordax TaxID=8014 RepID=UPI0035106373
MEESGHPSCESDTTTHLQGSGDAPMSTMNLYATLGLLPEDMDALAQMPESEISVETLPALIMQLKAKRAQEEARQRDVSPKTEIKKEHADSRDDRGPDNDDHSPPRKVPRPSVPFKKQHSSDRLSESETEARMNNQTNNETHNGTNPAQEYAETGGAMIQPLQAARVSDPPKKKSGQKKTRKGSNHEEARTTVNFVPTWAEMGTHETEAKAISVPSLIGH